jgi:hypothetical protein
MLSLVKELFGIFTRSQLRRLVMLQSLMVLMAFAEIGGVSGFSWWWSRTRTFWIAAISLANSTKSAACGSRNKGQIDRIADHGGEHFADRDIAAGVQEMLEVDQRDPGPGLWGELTDEFVTK